jgi:DNA integrity scanning protein DisA with diadenylate cyclase activity
MSAAAAWGGPAATIPTGEDGEVHRKAQRFARLLMDEIKLYNQAKVSEGRKHKDLYDRLKEDIEKSRATYQKRYGNTVAAGADYFNQELIRSLAEDDVSLLGKNFRR